jgi:hypothetical protein
MDTIACKMKLALELNGLLILVLPSLQASVALIIGRFAGPKGSMGLYLQMSMVVLIRSDGHHVFSDLVRFPHFLRFY